MKSTPTESNPSEIARYTNDPKFFTFVLKEFFEVSEYATIDELAEFAFGSLDEAIEAFKFMKSKQE